MKGARSRLASVMLVLAMLLPAIPAPAHDDRGLSDWIGEKRLKNRAGDWCCGRGDCALLDENAVSITRQGYVIRGYGTYFGDADSGGTVRERFNEIVPSTEALPSEDTHYWRCTGKSRIGRGGIIDRTCFFAPAQSY